MESAAVLKGNCDGEEILSIDWDISIAGLFLEKFWSPLDSFFQNGPPFGFCNNFLSIVKINSFNVKKGKINSFF